jgi:hypothetical protein
VGKVDRRLLYEAPGTDRRLVRTFRQKAPVTSSAGMKYRRRDLNPHSLYGYWILSPSVREYRLRIDCGTPVFPEKGRGSHFALGLSAACG